MSDLFPVTDEEITAELAREIAMREVVYPRKIARGKMSQEKADRAIAVLRAAQARLASPGPREREQAQSPSVAVLKRAEAILSEGGARVDVFGIRLAPWVTISARIPDAGTEAEKAREVVQQLRAAYRQADARARNQFRSKRLSPLEVNLEGAA